LTIVDLFVLNVDSECLLYIIQYVTAALCTVAFSLDVLCFMIIKTALVSLQAIHFLLS